MLGKENAFALAQGVAKWLTKFASTNILSPIERRRVNMYRTTRSDKTHSPYLKFAVKGRRSEGVEDSKRQILLKQTRQEIVIMRLVHRTTMQIIRDPTRWLSSYTLLKANLKQTIAPQRHYQI